MSDKRGPCKACEEWECRCVTSPAQQMVQQYAQENAQQYQPRPGTYPAQWQTARQPDVTQPNPDPRLTGLTVRLARLLVHRQTLETYSQHRMEDRDRHAVSDAANDLRELECEIRCVEEMVEMVGGKVT